MPLTRIGHAQLSSVASLRLFSPIRNFFRSVGHAGCHCTGICAWMPGFAIAGTSDDEEAGHSPQPVLLSVSFSEWLPPLFRTPWRLTHIAVKGIRALQSPLLPPGRRVRSEIIGDDGGSCPKALTGAVTSIRLAVRDRESGHLTSQRKENALSLVWTQHDTRRARLIRDYYMCMHCHKQ